MINPIEIIKRDHRKVEQLFKEYEELGDRAFESKRRVAGKIIAALKLHTDMEERLFYPRAKEVLIREDNKMIEIAYAEHDVAKRLLEELSVTHPEDPQFDARIKVLNENIAHHIKEEEEEMLPKIQETMKEEMLNGIGEEMRSYRIEEGAEEQGA